MAVVIYLPFNILIRSYIANFSVFFCSKMEKVGPIQSQISQKVARDPHFSWHHWKAYEILH